MSKETFAFQAEVSKLLNIVARSLYSHKEIFLRELVSNASDACDKLRYKALTEPGLGGDGFKIEISVDKKAKTLSIADNGIGMNREELAETLGTIARSGTEAFVEQLSGDEGKDMSLIGQFGVGFYSSFMVAGKVEMVTKKAGEDRAWRWTSEGEGEFTIEEAERPGPGATVILHLNKGEEEFLEKARLSNIIKTYSDHIGIPIVFKDGKDGKDEEALNTASALWTRPAKEITEEQYKEFYHHAAHAFDDPWMTLHNRVEGVLSYTNLIFIPSKPPFDLLQVERKSHLKLYVNRVFITDDCEGLIPPYLRFLKGIVDSEDLSLNISREMLQHDPMLAKIKSGLVKRVLGELQKKAEKQADEYAEFWNTFGAVLKEGLYEDVANRDKLLPLARFHSTHGAGLVSLEDYVGRMKDGQEAIYYISGENRDQLIKSPQLEGFISRGIEVLIMTDAIDEFWVPAVGTYAEKPLQSVTKGTADLDKIKSSDAAEDKKEDKEKTGEDISLLIAVLKTALDTNVKDVRVSNRLTDSPVCLVASEEDLDLNLQRFLKQHKQLDAISPRILEINPGHSLIRRLTQLAKDGKGTDPAMTDAAFLLLDQARVMEGEPVSDPSAFARRMAAMLEKGLVA